MLCVFLILVIVVPGLMVGLVVSVFQASTQIHEMSLSFIPKLMVTLIALIFTGSGLLKMILDYSSVLYREIPFLIG